MGEKAENKVESKIESKAENKIDKVNKNDKSDKKSTSNKYYEIILDWFKQQIIAGELKPGDVVPSERELANLFGVSRVPVREALRILEYIGIVSNGSGGMLIQKVDIQLLSPRVNFASEITMEMLENLFEVRIFLETAAAYYAAQRRTSEDIVQMRESIRQMSAAIDNPEADSKELIYASHQFHFHVIAAAKNPVLENIYRNLHDLLEVSKQYTLRPTHVSDATLMDHEAILYKIENGDSEEASRYMKYHLLRALKKLDLTEENPVENEKEQ
ncbi:MAG: FadR family transcriptional regulator [Lachnospiraceae bacterium]|nr:FadR family transcriptional regulator [Lachnospiraceae bacterium]